jgi:hypothetical protein
LVGTFDHFGEKFVMDDKELIEFLQEQLRCEREIKQAYINVNNHLLSEVARLKFGSVPAQGIQPRPEVVYPAGHYQGD